MVIVIRIHTSDGDHTMTTMKQEDKKALQIIFYVIESQAKGESMDEMLKTVKEMI